MPLCSYLRAAGRPPPSRIPPARRAAAPHAPEAADPHILAGGREADAVGLFEVTAESVKEVIVKTGLFTGHGEGRFG